MTLKEIEEQLFPCVYRARNGELVEITGFAFTGVILNEDNTKRDMIHVWDRNMNSFYPTQIHTRNPQNYDLVELVESPIIDPNSKKVQSLRKKVRPLRKAE